MNLRASWPYFSVRFQVTRLPTYDAETTVGFPIDIQNRQLLNSRAMPGRSEATLRVRRLNLRFFFPGGP